MWIKCNHTYIHTVCTKMCVVIIIATSGYSAWGERNYYCIIHQVYALWFQLTWVYYVGCPGCKLYLYPERPYISFESIAGEIYTYSSICCSELPSLPSHHFICQHIHIALCWSVQVWFIVQVQDEIYRMKISKAIMRQQSRNIPHGKRPFSWPI